jgi:hypothetical protein
MRSKLTISAVVIAALSGVTAPASAQTQPAPGGTSSKANVGSDATQSNMKPGTTTGSATKAHTNKGIAPNSTVQDDKDSGTGRGK